MKVSLIVFLGNKGHLYKDTRHNAGWLFYEDFMGTGESLSEKFHGLHGIETVHSTRVRVLLPHTYMNESGRSVFAMMNYFSIPLEEILVVHDDIELPFGRVTLQRGGGMGGHNGLKSIKKACSGSEFLRLRIGIGRPTRGDVSSHVLGRFNAEEEPLLHDIFSAGDRFLSQVLADTDDKVRLPLSAMLL